MERAPGKYFLCVTGTLLILLGIIGIIFGFVFETSGTRLDAIIRQAVERDSHATPITAFAAAEEIVDLYGVQDIGAVIRDDEVVTEAVYAVDRIVALITRAVNDVAALAAIPPGELDEAAEKEAIISRAVAAVQNVLNLHETRSVNLVIEQMLDMMGIHGAAAGYAGINFMIIQFVNICLIGFGAAGIYMNSDRKRPIIPLVLGTAAMVMCAAGAVYFNVFSLTAMILWAVPVCYIIGAYSNCGAYIRTRYSTVLRYSILIGVGLILIYPLIWMVGSSFKYNFDIFGNLSVLPPAGRATTEFYPAAWQLTARNTMTFYYLNTLRFLIPRVIGTVLSCTLTAYAIARFKFPGKRIVFMVVIITLLMPELAFRIPIFMLYRDINLIDTFAALYIQEFFAVGSFFVFMIIQFMRTIPRELDEAAYIDGCGPLRTLIYILVPVLRPIIITVGLLTFMWGMNDFQGPLIFLNSPDRHVLALALRLLISDYEVTNYGQVFAAAFMALIPTLAIFFTCSKYFVESVASSGGKE
jgi:oligogalacturonide transport system permease protein